MNNTVREYEIQYFGFSREFLKDSLKYMVETEFKNNVSSVENLITTLKLKGEALENHRKTCSYLLEFCLNKSTTNLNQIYADLDKFFSIPNEVSLPEDEYYQEIVSQGDIEIHQKELEELESTILSLGDTELILENELKKAEHFKARILVEEEKLTSVLSDLESKHQ